MRSLHTFGFGFGLFFSLCALGCEGTSVLGASNQNTTGENQDGGGTGGSAGAGGSGGMACETTEQCPIVDAQCSRCSDGTPNCPHYQCIEGSCALSTPRCAGPILCETTEQCPIVDAECTRCSDGTPSCPHYECIEGQCLLSTPRCAQPVFCETNAQCPAIDAECTTCPDGSQSCPRYECVPSPSIPIGGICELRQPECPRLPCTTSSECNCDLTVCDPVTRSCEDGSFVMIRGACVDNSCVHFWPACGRDLCAGKACGEHCFPPCNDFSLCAPSYCDASGACLQVQTDCD